MLLILILLYRLRSRKPSLVGTHVTAMPLEATLMSETIPVVGLIELIVVDSIVMVVQLGVGVAKVMGNKALMVVQSPGHQDRQSTTG